MFCFIIISYNNQNILIFKSFYCILIRFNICYMKLNKTYIQDYICFILVVILVVILYMLYVVY